MSKRSFIRNNLKEMLKPKYEKILLTMILPFVIFVVFFQLTLKPNTVIIHYAGQMVFSDNPRWDVLIKSLIFASVYSIPNWIWSYPFSAFVVWKSEKVKKK
jgi:ABC-type spermidine/putrescine transport system permease subunit I